MARRVFFSFHHQNDIWEVNQVRNAYALRGLRETQPIIDGAAFEAIKRQGDYAVKNWIDREMRGCGVLAVLIGPQTYSRRWVKYEIEKAHTDRMGIIGISLQGMRGRNGFETKASGPSPFDYANIGTLLTRPSIPTYSWVYDSGRNNISTWVEAAARAAGR